MIPREIENWLVNHPSAFANRDVARNTIRQWWEGHVPVDQLNEYVERFYVDLTLEARHELGEEMWSDIDAWWNSTISREPPSGLFSPLTNCILAKIDKVNAQVYGDKQ